jgi:hypothetical protein
VVLFFVPNPLGGNYARALIYFAPALCAFVATVPGRRLVAAFVAPLLIWQFVPASSALASDPSSDRAYYAPLVSYVEHQPAIGRVEIPFTSTHWEAAFVAPEVPLARGWLRQLDVLDNPVFYDPDELTATSYHRWLVDNGVTWVALPDVPLDYSAVREGQLLEHGVPGLRLVWSDAHWRVWKVVDSSGLISGSARLTTLQPDHITLDATGTGTALLRVHYTSTWSVTSGAACVRDDHNWTEIVTRRAGRIDLTTSLLPTNSACPN